MRKVVKILLDEPQTPKESLSNLNKMHFKKNLKKLRKDGDSKRLNLGIL